MRTCVLFALALVIMAPLFSAPAHAASDKKAAPSKTAPVKSAPAKTAPAKAAAPVQVEESDVGKFGVGLYINADPGLDSNRPSGYSSEIVPQIIYHFFDNLAATTFTPLMTDYKGVGVKLLYFSDPFHVDKFKPIWFAGGGYEMLMGPDHKTYYTSYDNYGNYSGVRSRSSQTTLSGFVASCGVAVDVFKDLHMPDLKDMRVTAGVDLTFLTSSYGSSYGSSFNADFGKPNISLTTGIIYYVGQF
jgi:hypothetical protein